VKEQFWLRGQLYGPLGSLPYNRLYSQLAGLLGGLLYSRLGDPLKVQLHEDLKKR